ncbi:MAG TPA: YggU family protein [Methanoculleus sp.]|nr:YggU family protein [Methanoculleus sp.]
MFAQAIQEDETGAIISLDVSPGARKDRFPAGYNEWRKSISCQIRAPPVEGKANKAIQAAVASALGVPKADVAIISGATSSQKRVRIEMMTKDEVIARLSPAFAPGHAP